MSFRYVHSIEKNELRFYLWTFLGGFQHSLDELNGLCWQTIGTHETSGVYAYLAIGSESFLLEKIFPATYQ